MSKWEPYFRPTRRVHDSGFRCFECGYLIVGDDKKAKQKKVISSGVDHIGYMKTDMVLDVSEGMALGLHMDLLKDGNIRIFSNVTKGELRWNIPGISDAFITVVPKGGEE